MSNTKNNGKAPVAEATAKTETAPQSTISEATPTLQTAELAKKSPTIEQQINFFEGLEILVNMCRRLEGHKAAVAVIDLEEDELNQFENTNNYGPRIALYDSNRNEYVVRNPRLLAEMKDFLLSRLSVKIDEIQSQILAYGN